MNRKWSLTEDIVVSGISGRFPECENVDEFMDNLYAKKDMVVEDERRWPFGFLGLPKGSGKLKDISLFDADFFDVSESEANQMDAQIRIMMELTYEALWDAGMDPNSLGGTVTGTFIGNCFDEVPSAIAEDYSKAIGYKQHFAGRLAQVFNLTGPSMVLDTACASSFCALHEALCALRSNRCDRAIVVGANMSLRASTQLQFYKLNMISPDGHCKCLDSDANGYAKGEACVVVILQKKSEAKRIYATLVHTKSNTDGFKELGITFPSSTSQCNLMCETYSEANINPHDVKYVEAHCTGTQAGDPVEMAAIVGAMCTDRVEPLLIGAVKASIGHTEGSSGLCSLTKVIFSMQNQCIPPNIHMKTPNPKIEGLVSGILKPITESTPFKEELVGLNCFGFGGVNVHVIARSDSREPSPDNHNIFEGIPRLVLMCGRSEDTLKYSLINILKTRQKMTRDYLFLINDISKTSAFKNKSNNFEGMPYRGFALKDNTNASEEDSNEITINRVSDTKPQVWYIFSGMGSQWAGMAKSLMCLSVFAQSVQKSAQVLSEYNCDLMTILLEDNKTLMGCPLNSFISLSAIQIALVDVLKQLDVKPDGIVGHSVGELVCAYADNCLTHEETIRIAYLRGSVIRDDKKSRGKMAAIGLSLEEVQKRLPSDVFIACHNSDDSITVSGTEAQINEFISQLSAEDVFARPVDSTGIAFHSPLLLGIRKQLNEKLSAILPTKRMRSSKWLTTVYEKTDMKSSYISSEYFTDNLILPVLFSDALKQIPRDAVVIEVSAHHLLQPIIKRSLGSDITYIPLMKKNENNIQFLLKSVGRLYSTGINPSIEKLYPKVELPVSRGTPTISPLIKWEHNKSYTVYQYPHYFNPIGFSDFAVKVDLQDTEDAYMSDHCVDGRILFPATGYLMLAWKQLAKQMGVTWDELPVEFENVCLHRATILPKVGVTKFDIRILETSGQFVITESGTVAVTGKIFAPQMASNQYEYLLDEQNNREVLRNESDIILKTNDIYKELRLRGYDYGKYFQCLTEAVVDTTKVRAAIKWINWVTFADSMIQMAILGKKSRGLYLPVRIDSLKCDPMLLLAQIHNKVDTECKELPVLFDYYLGIGVAKGLEFRGIKANLAPRKVFARIPIVEHYSFVPYDEECSSIKTTERQHLEQYMRQCFGVTLNLIKKFKYSLKDFKSFDPIIRAQLEKEQNNSIDPINNDSSGGNDSEDRCLLQLLMDLNCIENNEINEKMIAEYNQKMLGMDNCLLNKSFMREEFLRQQLETVIENINCNNNRINVLEISQSQTIIAQNIIQFIHLSAFDMKVNYSLLHPMVANLSPDLLNEVESHQWIVEKSRLPPDLDNYELILYEDRIDLSLTEVKINLTTLLESIWKSVKENGFLIVVIKSKLNFSEEVLLRIYNELQNNNNNNEKNCLSNEWLSGRKTQIISEAERLGFSLIGTKMDTISNKSSLIFRKICSDFQIENQTFIQITNDKCEQWIEKLQEEMEIIKDRPESENIWLLGEGNPTNGIIGFVNCLRKETNGHRIRCIFNNDLNNKENSNLLKNRDFLQTIVKKNLVMNVLKSGNKAGSFRHFTIDLNDNTVPSEHCYINVQTKGDLSSFKWFEAQHKFWPLGKQSNEQLIDVYYAPLNFRDIMLATGKLSADALPDDMGLQDCILGLEFAGRDQNSNRVMGMTPSKGLATTVVMQDLDFVWPIPQHWSMEEASTVPVVYATAYYALIIRGKLRPRESVLIHSGSGGVGQAAIAICLSMECQLFITCGSESKREFLKKEFFPKLCDKNFCSSRDSGFESYIISETNGRGVDLVLNSLSEEKLQASVRCLATSGRFLEIGKYDLSQNNELGLSSLLRNKTFHGILLDSLFVDQSKCTPLLKSHKRKVRELIDNGIKDGTVRPLKRTVFDCCEVESAFRFMASGKHIGKVVLKIRDENNDNVSVRFPSISRTVFKPNKSYLIIGGLGGFGLELSNWLIERGVQNLVLTSRSGIKTPYQMHRIKCFRELGINVKICTKDVSDLKSARNLIKNSAHMGSSQGVGGIFNLAMVLCDGLFDNQTAEQFAKVLAPKALAAHHLDTLSRELCNDLDYFVCFSSVSCGRGNPGQTNYGFANSVMERICEERRACGLPGLAVQWGAIGDVGVVAENMGGNDVVIGGTLPQRIPSCLATFDSILQLKYPVVSSIVKSDHKIEASNKKGDLMKIIAHILGLKDYMNLNSNTTLGELGMDSLMSVEVKQLLERDSDLVLSMQEIRKLSISRIASIGQKSESKPQSETQICDKNLPTNDLIFEIPVERITYLNDVRDGKPVLLLPPIEGTFSLLSDLAKHIKRPVIGLNWTHDCQPLKSIEEIAEYYLNIIIDILRDTSEDSYDLMGYSFGGCVAYEMAVQLQRTSTNMEPKLIFLDSSPVQFRLFADEVNKKYQFSDNNSQQLESLIAFLNQYVSVDYQKVKQILENTPIEERVDRVSQIFLDSQQIETNHENIEFIAKTFSNKLLMLNTYCVDSCPKYSGDCLLIRAEDVIIKNSQLIRPDYGLSEVISGKCQTIVMKGDHKSFLNQNVVQLIELVNNYLD